MKEGKFNLFDLQREELSKSEIEEIYSKDDTKNPEGCDNNKTEEDKILQKLEEKLFSVSSKLDKNPSNRKLIKEYAETETEIKEIKDQEVKDGIVEQALKAGSFEEFVAILEESETDDDKDEIENLIGMIETPFHALCSS